jgi:hypothetical protein
MRSGREPKASLERGFLPISPNKNPDACEKFFRRGLRRQAGRFASTLLSRSCKMQAKTPTHLRTETEGARENPQLENPPLPRRA